MFAYAQSHYCFKLSSCWFYLLISDPVLENINSLWMPSITSFVLFMWNLNSLNLICLFICQPASFKWVRIWMRWFLLTLFLTLKKTNALMWQTQPLIPVESWYNVPVLKKGFNCSLGDMVYQRNAIYNTNNHFISTFSTKQRFTNICRLV